LLHTKTSAILHLCYLALSYLAPLQFRTLVFGTSAIWHLSYLAFVGFVEKNLFCLALPCVLDYHTSIFLVLIFVLYIAVSAAR